MNNISAKRHPDMTCHDAYHAASPVLGLRGALYMHANPPIQLLHRVREKRE